LIQGVHRFHSRVFRRRRQQFERLARGQHPEALFITCSDSRIDPAMLTQTEPGSLFVLRNAGNMIPPHGSAAGEEATIEFALGALGIRDIVVCGHTNCGAMKGLLQPGSLSRLPAVSRWLDHAGSTRRIVLETYPHLEGDRLIEAAARENVLVQIENLLTHPAVQTRIDGGGLRLHGWVYSIETGEVAAFDPALDRFLPILADSTIPSKGGPKVSTCREVPDRFTESPGARTRTAAGLERSRIDD
jgi:carbonic anhydrase